MNDHPDKVATSADRTETHLAPQLRAVVDKTKRELFLVSPYFVPGTKGVELLAALHRRGVRVVVITNSLGSTDGVAVHSKYHLYRKALIEAGVELYEMKRAAQGVERNKSMGPFGSSGSSLHAKTFAVDRSRVFVGSFNFDPRSARLNTEMGFVIESPALAETIADWFAREVPTRAYQVTLGDAGRLRWIDRHDGMEALQEEEPGTGVWRRFAVAVLSVLPIEWLL
jgi:putative cardiolipin synthase